MIEHIALEQPQHQRLCLQRNFEQDICSDTKLQPRKSEHYSETTSETELSPFAIGALPAMRNATCNVALHSSAFRLCPALQHVGKGHPSALEPQFSNNFIQEICRW